MGATTFYTLAKGADAEVAFREARDQAQYERGHEYDSGTIGAKGSFGFLTRTPVSQPEAYRLAGADLDSDRSRFSDKGGPAGCIPVVTGLRTIRVEGIEGDARDKDGAVRAVVAERRLLKRGETVEKVWLSSYSQPQPVGYGYRSSGSSRFTNGVAEVTVRTPLAASSRTVAVSVTLRGSHTREQAEAAVREALAAGRNRLRERETISRIALETMERPAERTFRTSAVAPKGKTVTRYVVSGTRHATWETGLGSQSEARAVAVAAAERAPRAFWDNPEASFEVTAVTRREDGSPLVAVRRSLMKTVYTAQVTITHSPDVSGRAPDAWLFFGWAPC